MAESHVTLITWEKIVRELLFITAVLLDLHSVLFATEGVFAEYCVFLTLTEAFGK